MSDQQPDPWATVREEWIEDAGGGRMMQYATDVDDARAEVERRHAEELKAKDEQILRLKALVESMHQPALEAQIAAAGQVAMLNRRAYLEAQEKLESLRAQLAEKDDEIRDLTVERGHSATITEKNAEISQLLARLAAVQETAQAVLREWDDYKTTGQLRAGGAMYDLRVALEPLTLKEPKA